MNPDAKRNRLLTRPSLFFLATLAMAGIPAGIVTISSCTSHGDFVLAGQLMNVRTRPLIDTVVFAAGLIAMIRICGKHGLRMYALWTIVFVSGTLAFIHVVGRYECAYTKPIVPSLEASVALNYVASIFFGAFVLILPKIRAMMGCSQGPKA